MKNSPYKWASTPRPKHTALDALTFSVLGWCTHECHPRILAILHNAGKPCPLRVVHASLLTGYGIQNIRRLLNDLANADLVTSEICKDHKGRPAAGYYLTEKGASLIAAAQRKAPTP
jgi:hypothetical protein